MLRAISYFVFVTMRKVAADRLLPLYYMRD